MAKSDNSSYIRKNVYVEGLANYRDNLPKHFRLSLKQVPSIVTLLIVFPALIYHGM